MHVFGGIPTLFVPQNHRSLTLTHYVRSQQIGLEFKLDPSVCEPPEDVVGFLWVLQFPLTAQRHAAQLYGKVIMFSDNDFFKF